MGCDGENYGYYKIRGFLSRGFSARDKHITFGLDHSLILFGAFGSSAVVVFTVVQKISPSINVTLQFVRVIHSCATVLV